VAARHADIVAFTGAQAVTGGGPLLLAGAKKTADRIAWVRAALGDRADVVEYNIMLQKVVGPGESADLLETYRPAFTEEAAANPEDIPTQHGGLRPDTRPPALSRPPGGEKRSARTVRPVSRGNRIPTAGAEIGIGARGPEAELVRRVTHFSLPTAPVISPDAVAWQAISCANDSVGGKSCLGGRRG